MSQLANQHWNISRATAACRKCAKSLAPGDSCWAALVDGLAEPSTDGSTPVAEIAATGYGRVDYCDDCWAAGARPEPPLVLFSHWRTSIPVPQQKKKLLVDDAVLVDLFTRLADQTAPQDVQFRFVLALILMRKRWLKYEGTDTGPDALETWRMTLRGGEAVTVINPKLTNEQIAGVSTQLSSILAEAI
jgi:hypothetical protein